MRMILTRLQQKIFEKARQKETGTFLGGIKTQLERSAFYIAIINFGLILITAYHTTIHPIFPAIPFGAFLASLVVLILGVVIFEYIIVYPSEVAFAQHQIWKEKRNPLFREIATIKGDNKEILNRLQLIEKVLDNVRKD